MSKKAADMLANRMERTEKDAEHILESIMRRTRWVAADRAAITQVILDAISRELAIEKREMKE